MASCFETTSNRIPQINSNVYCVPKIKDKQKNMTQQKLIHGNNYVYRRTSMTDPYYNMAASCLWEDNNKLI